VLEVALRGSIDIEQWKKKNKKKNKNKEKQRKKKKNLEIGRGGKITNPLSLAS